MSRDWRLFLDDIIDACHMILDFTQGMDRDSFVTDKRTYLAVLRLIEVTGEAVKSIPQDIQDAHPDTAWRDIIGTRNVLAHVYFGVDDDIIWNVVSTEIEPLLSTLETIKTEHCE